MRKVTASAKGQLTLPADILRALGAKGRTEFLVVQEGDRIVLAPAHGVGRALLDDLAGWSALAEPSFRDVWDNDADEVWNDA